MKLRTSVTLKKLLIENVYITIFLIAIAVFFVLVTFGAPSYTVAEGADIGTLTITHNGEEYVSSDGAGTRFSDVSLQNVINYAESVYSQTVFNFDNLTVNETLTFKKSSLLQGTINFVLNSSNSNTYAMTVNSKATLILQGLILNSNRGALKVNSGKLEIRSAAITVSECNVTCSAINVQDQALISGATIVYSAGNSAFGYGVSVNGGRLTVTPEAEVPVRIEGHSGLCITSGSAEINGGSFIAHRSTGYSVDAQNGELIINDGVFTSPINDIRSASSAKININGGSISSVRVTPNQNKRLNIGSAEIHAGNYCELTLSDIDFTANTMTVEGKKSSQGFRTVGYTVDSAKIDGAAITVNTYNEKTITPIEDNHYSLSLACDGKIYKTISYEYGTNVKLNELPAPEKLGYILSGWVEKKGNFNITDDITLNAVTVLCDAEIELADSVFTYNGSKHTITPVLTHALSVTYTAYWERYTADEWEKVCDENALDVTAVADSGTYRFTAIAAFGNDTSTSQKEITVIINKGTYENITHPELSGVYSPSKRLSSFNLEDNFSWVNRTTVPTVPVKQYPAIYNADPDNYENYEVNITINLQKAAAVSQQYPYELSGVYEKKQLKDYPLSDGFRWQSPDQIPTVNITSYNAFYNPDTDNYEDKQISIILRLEKGTYSAVEHLEDMTLTYRPDYFLSDLSRDITKEHANYRLEYSSDSKLNAGTRELKCIYNDDPVNYNDYKFTFNLTVNKADIDASEVPQVPSFTGTYSGLTLSEFSLGGNLYWRNPELVATVDVHQYDAFYNPEPENYNDYALKVTISLQKGTYNAVIAPTPDAITYNRDLTLSDISLPAGWAWADGTITPTVAVNIYQAQYCADSINYQPFETAINLTVNKADIPLAVLPDKTVTYDGKTHYLEFDFLPYPLELVEFVNNGNVQAGKYEVTAKLRQTDTENYNLHPVAVRGILNILKAPSVINAPSRYDILEGGTVSIEGTVDNNEQTLIIPEFNEKDFGLYQVTLTTAESSNYLAGSRTVTISINKTEKYVGNISYPVNYDGTYLYGILINTQSGVPNDAEISFRPFDSENYFMGIEISVTVNGSAYDKKFTAKIKMTDAMLSASALRLYNENGEEIAFTVENNVYLTFETDSNCIFYLNAEFDKKFAWYWIPIGIAIALIAIGAVLVVLWKKGIIKLPLKLPHKTAKDTAAKSENEATATETIKEQKSEESLERK